MDCCSCRGANRCSCFIHDITYSTKFKFVSLFEGITYPVCLEDVVEGEERHHSKHETQERRLERGLEVKVGVGACVHPACQGGVILEKDIWLVYFKDWLCKCDIAQM